MRAVLGGVALVALLVLLNGYLAGTAGESVTSVAAEQADRPLEERDRIVPPANGVTVMTGHGFGGGEGDSLTALSPDGRLLYHENEYNSYFDVDPSPAGDTTVLTVGATHLDGGACGSGVPPSKPLAGLDPPDCVRDTIVRINLSTGEREVLYTFVGVLCVLEYRWSPIRIDVRSPFGIRRE